MSEELPAQDASAHVADASFAEITLRRRGRIRRYKGTIPRLAPHVLLDIARVRRKVDRAIRRVPADAPWTAPKAEELDSQTLASWLRKASTPGSSGAEP